MNADGALAARLTHKLTGAGIMLDRAGLSRLGEGADNLAFVARTIDGRPLVIKTPLRQHARYSTAAWAARALASQHVPAPQVLWADETTCVETFCPGIPLTGTADRLDTFGTPPHPAVLRAARDAGMLLHRAHTIEVRGYGKLTPAGAGPARSLQESLLAASSGVGQGAPTGSLASKARRLVADNLWRLTDPGPHLLLGDCAARHIFVDTATGMISGFIDLESARGGDSLADVAGFSVREHPHVTQALLDGYFTDGPTIDQTWALTLHRARIARSLLLFHADRGEHDIAQRIADCLQADLTSIGAETPTVLPANLM